MNKTNLSVEKSVLLVLIKNRKESAEKVQKILSGWGCFIKTRLGIHDGVLDNCSDQGLIFLELAGGPTNHEELMRKLKLMKGVDAKLVTLKVED